MQEHLTGKQYLGWKIIREKFAELTKKFETRAASREPEERPVGRSSSHPAEEARPRDARERERERERSPVQ